MDRWSKIQPADDPPDESSSSSASSCWTEKQAADELSEASSSSSAGGTRYSYKTFRRKKKPAPRRADPGRRYRGRRVYDSTLGITCHFCRQKTTDKHVICGGRTCVLTLCGNCLRNRHGEDVKIETAEEDYVWICPKCRGGCGPGCKCCCTCSFCRQKRNLRPPKFSNSEMQAHGFDNVHDYLIFLETGESPESISARKLGKGWCRTQKISAPKGSKNSKVHKQGEANTKKSSDEVIETQEFTSKLPKRSKTDANKGSDDALCSANNGKGENNTRKGGDVTKERNAQGNKGSDEALCSANNGKGENDTRKGGDVTKECNAQGRPPKESFPSQFSSRNDYKERLKATLAKPFNSQEMSGLWDAINCRKPLWKAMETLQGTINFPTKELGSSYFMQHADLARKLMATSDKDEKLKILRGFFFWLEHASMSGAYKPWLENDKDEECIELAGPDCQILGVRINLDEHRPGKSEEQPQPNNIKQGAEVCSSSQAKGIFNWDDEDVKPRIEEKWVRWGKFSSADTGVHVKEEPDA